MERKILKYDYKHLAEIRINSTCTYKTTISIDNKNHAIHVLDEVMENVNLWVKMLPVNHNPMSWITHSNNVTLARKCMYFENQEYKRGSIDFEHLLEHGEIKKRNISATKYVEPNKKTEKERVFEFIVTFFEVAVTTN